MKAPKPVAVNANGRFSRATTPRSAAQELPVNPAFAGSTTRKRGNLVSPNPSEANGAGPTVCCQEPPPPRAEPTGVPLAPRPPCGLPRAVQCPPRPLERRRFASL